MTTAYSPELEECVIELHKIGAVKFGDFTLKSGIKSPIYFDLRTVISYPNLLSTVADLLWKTAKRRDFDHLCGVPYTALPIATIISIKNDIPMLIRRKETKNYGTKKIIEGCFTEEQNCLIIEDVIVSGSSIIETANILRNEMLKVDEAIVFLDREQGGVDNLKNFNINITSVITIHGVLEILYKHEKIDEISLKKTVDYIDRHSNVSVLKELQPQSTKDEKKHHLSLLERAEKAQNPLTKRLLTLIHRKKTNLCVAVDVQTSRELISLSDEVGPFICLLKTHIDIVKDFDLETVEALKSLAEKHDFLIFEDRKFADIGNTVKMQYSNGLYHISDWAHLVTVHGIAGPDMLQGMISTGSLENRGCVIVAEMSSSQNLTSENYVKGCVNIGRNHPQFVVGFVCQSQVCSDPEMILFTPGVNISNSGDTLGQNYVSPEAAVLERGADIVIVGRGITSHENPSEMAQKYREISFSSLQARSTTAESSY